MPEIHHGNALEVLSGLPSDSAHCVVTSPPYWGLRDYGLAPTHWPSVRFSPVAGLPEIEAPAQDAVLGLEPDPWHYVAHLVAVFREVRRVLRGDGTLWLNLGDCFAGGGSGGKQGPTGQRANRTHTQEALLKTQAAPGLKPGDRVGMPWRVAQALQADGWWLRQENIWAKHAPMPESLNGWRWERCRRKIRMANNPLAQGYRSWTVDSGNPDWSRRDGNNAEWQDCPGCPKCRSSLIEGWVLRRSAWRPTTAHEQVFLLSKSPRYYCDREAVSTEAKAGSSDRANRGNSAGHKLIAGADGQRPHAFHQPRANKQDGVGKATYTGFNARYRPLARANLRSVWRIPRRAFKGRHFATFPPGLPEICVRAGTPERGVCAICGAPRARVMKSSGAYQRKTLFWYPTCACEAPDPAPAVVLDPFSGAGTTLRVAESLGRRGIGIELNADYIEMAEAAK